MTVLYFGRPRDRAANLQAAEYAKRLGRFCDFRMQEVRNEKALGRRDRAYQVALDPGGRELGSGEFAELIRKAENGALRELVFVVGGADGVPAAARAGADLLLALSRLTLPHELARVVLVEQIYRAFTMLRGHPYAR